ncbi:hypothetical protein KC19_4G187900 [Ceratodon purpureus]|uniref:Thioredoxin domain-containing protein n=1 Tax=Ceratodon purpureus TaxID=3225 RepID=A0A8T0ICK6_CERPU|nr:hypothetical protein KC19_4G187900 [Ceratodon purpureus]
MALQCTQLPIPTSVRFDETSKAVAKHRRSFYGGSSQGLKNSNSILQARFLHHCKRDVTRQTRQWNKRSTLCVRAKEQKPTWVEMIPITGEAQFDEVLQSENPVIIDWMAAWCRKCIYLKPKLEKLAAEYDPDIKFYFVDVNTVPSTLVSRAGVTKMPTIQLWKNKEKAGEIIGGDQGWLVMDKIREMLTVKK